MITARSIAGAIVCVVMTSFCCKGANAAEWSAESSLAVRGIYNSNLLLTAAPHEATWGQWVSPGMKYAGATENFEVSGRTDADFVQYYGGNDQTLTNMNFPLSMNYRTERETFALDGGFTRDNTLMGELQQTGVVLRFTQRNYWNVAPSWTHALTERLSVQAGYQYSSASYESGAQLGLVDYTTHGASTGLSYRPTERDVIRATGMFTNFHAPEASDLRSNIYGGQVEWMHDFTESITGSISGGGELVSSEIHAGSMSPKDTQTVWVGSATLFKKWEDSTLKLEARREVYPSGFGLLLQTSRVGIGITKDMTERLRFSLDAAAYLAESVGSPLTGVTFPKNRYITVTPSVHWRMAEWWALDVNYTYANREVVGTRETAFSNSAMVMLTYFPPKWSMGR